MDLGFEQEGHYQVIWANDTYKNARETYKRNFPNIAVDRRDLRSIPVEDIPDCDGIVGGPPCQPFSTFGARRGAADPRGTLAFEFVRVVDAKRPRFFVLENVAALASHKRYQDVYSTLLHAFKHIGYKIHQDILLGTDYGIAQSRKRLFLVGIRNDHSGKYNTPPSIRSNKKLTMRNAIGDLACSAQPTKGYQTQNPRINAHEYVPLSVNPLTPWFIRSQRVRDWNKPSFSVVSTVASMPLHPSSPKLIQQGKKDYRLGSPISSYRRMTARECARLQGFPDEYTFEYTSISPVYKMIGNAVPPPLAKAVAKSVYTTLITSVMP